MCICSPPCSVDRDQLRAFAVLRNVAMLSPLARSAAIADVNDWVSAFCACAVFQVLTCTLVVSPTRVVVIGGCEAVVRDLVVSVLRPVAVGYCELLLICVVSLCIDVVMLTLAEVVIACWLPFAATSAFPASWMWLRSSVAS